MAYIEVEYAGYKMPRSCTVELKKDRMSITMNSYRSRSYGITDNFMWTNLIRNADRIKKIENACNRYRDDLDIEILKDAESELIEIQPIYLAYCAKSFLIEQLLCELSNEFYKKQRKVDFVDTEENAKRYIDKELNRVLRPYLELPYILNVIKDNELKTLKRVLKKYLEYAEQIKCFGEEWKIELEQIKKQCLDVPDGINNSDSDRQQEELEKVKLILLQHLEKPYSHDEVEHWQSKLIGLNICADNTISVLGKSQESREVKKCEIEKLKRCFLKYLDFYYNIFCDENKKNIVIQTFLDAVNNLTYPEDIENEGKYEIFKLEEIINPYFMYRDDKLSKFLNLRKQIRQFAKGRNLKIWGYQEVEMEIVDLKKEFMSNIYKANYKSSGYMTTPIDKIGLVLSIFKVIIDLQKNGKLEKSEFRDFLRWEFLKEKNISMRGREEVETTYNELLIQIENWKRIKASDENSRTMYEKLITKGEYPELTIFSYLELMLLSLYKFFDKKPNVAVCQNCNRIFIGENKKRIYCPYIFKNGKTCDQVGKNETRNKKKESLPGLNEYNKIYQRMKKRAKSSSAKSIPGLEDGYNDKSQKWIEKTKVLKTKYEQGKISEKEFEDEIKEIEKQVNAGKC